MSQYKYEVIRHFTNEIELFVKNRFLHLSLRLDTNEKENYFTI